MGNQAHRPACLSFWAPAFRFAAAGMTILWCAAAQAQVQTLDQTAEALTAKALAGSGAYAIVESLTVEVGARPTGWAAMTARRLGDRQADGSHFDLHHSADDTLDKVDAAALGPERRGMGGGGLCGGRDAGGLSSPMKPLNPRPGRFRSPGV